MNISMSFISILVPQLAGKHGRGIEITIGNRLFICSNQDKESFESMKNFGNKYLHFERSEDGHSLYTAQEKGYSPHWTNCYLETKDGNVWYVSVVDISNVNTIGLISTL